VFSQLESEKTEGKEPKNEKKKKKAWKRNVSKIMRRLNTDVFSQLESEEIE